VVERALRDSVVVKWIAGTTGFTIGGVAEAACIAHSRDAEVSTVRAKRLVVDRFALIMDTESTYPTGANLASTRNGPIWCSCAPTSFQGAR
jgi:hypothetical protein